MRMDGIRARLPRLLQREALRLTLLRCHRSARPPSGIDRGPVLGLSAHVLHGLTCDLASTVHTARQPVPQRLCSPPLWACRWRSSASRTSCTASRIRQPGGRRGPPWLSWSIPRTAAPYPSTPSPASSSPGACLVVAKPRAPGAQGAAGAASDGSIRGGSSPWGLADGRGGSGVAAWRRSASTRRALARRPRTVLRLLTCACLSMARTGWATARRKWGWPSRCGTPTHSSAMAVTQASCLADLHARTGLSTGAAHWRARMINRRTSCVARDHKGAAHHTRLHIHSRTTDHVAWPFAGWRPSSVRLNDPLSR